VLLRTILGLRGRTPARRDVRQGIEQLTPAETHRHGAELRRDVPERRADQFLTVAQNIQLPLREYYPAIRGRCARRARGA
jgi:hypothetical protein